ncbi:MAG: ATP-binding protein [Proteobacteria bacterium]|nr:ATP-binding protein [Pseudomonadota bacterium]
MQETSSIVNGMADLANIQLAAVVAETLLNRSAGQDGIGVMYGPSGFGKTVAVSRVANLHDGYYVRLSDTWTRKVMLQKILFELGVTAVGTLSNMLDQAAEQLATSRRLLILDEFDYAASSAAKVNLIRDLHDNSNKSAILCVGEEALSFKLAEHKNFYGRVFRWAPAQPVSLADAHKLMAMYCGPVTVADDLLAVLVKQVKGSVRLAVNNLEFIKETAINEGWDVVTREHWGNRTLYTGSAPRRGGE